MRHLLFKKTFVFILLLSLLTTALNACFAQPDLQNAKSYFQPTKDGNYLKQLISTSLPTSSDCQQVFKDSSAITYYQFIEDLRKEVKKDSTADSTHFADVQIRTFTTEDILAEKGNYAGGMKAIAGRLKPQVTFYQLYLLKHKDDEAGVAFNYWVYLNGRWVFFFKPWRAFKAVAGP